MSVVVRITELNPVHGVAAEGNVTIDNTFKIIGVTLHFSPVRGTYSIKIPTDSHGGKPIVDLIDKDLKTKVLDGMISQYEKRILHSKYDSYNNSYESNRIQNRRSQEFKKELIRQRSSRSS